MMMITVMCAVFGCPTLPSTDDYWYRREGDSLVVGCNSSSDRWSLVCKNQRWIGEIGNCSNALTGLTLLLFLYHVYECNVISNIVAYSEANSRVDNGQQRTL